jgi:serine/threonine protein kinase
MIISRYVEAPISLGFPWLLTIFTNNLQTTDLPCRTDIAQSLPLFRSLHRRRALRQNMCQRQLLRSVCLILFCHHYSNSILTLRSDAASLVRTIFKAVKYIHDCGIVHRGSYLTPNINYSLWCRIDLKPENLLFRTQAEDADIMIADFGLSRVMEEEKLNLLTEICGTPGVRSSSLPWKLPSHMASDSTWLQKYLRRVRICHL